MAVILNNPMPTTGALFVTNPANPQGKFYKWLGRHYIIKGKKLVKRKRPITVASKTGRTYDKRKVWGRYKKVYDALSAKNPNRKSVLKVYKKDLPHRIREDRIARKKMKEIFSKESKKRKKTTAKKRKAPTRRRSSAKKSATKKSTKISATAKKKAALTYKRSRSTKKWQNLAKKYGTNTAKQIVRLSKSSKISTRGSTMAKRKAKKRNPRVYSKPKLQKLVYPKTSLGTQLSKLVRNALKNIPMNATKADINNYLSRVNIPRGYKAVIAEDIYQAFQTSDKKPAVQADKYAIRTMAKMMAKDLGVLSGSEEDKKILRAYLRKMSKYLKKAQRDEVSAAYVTYLKSLKTAEPVTIVEVLDATSEDYKPLRKRKSPAKKRRKSPAKKRRKPTRKRKTSARKRKASSRKSKRVAPKGAYQKLVKKYGVTEGLREYKSKYKLRGKRTRKLRRNPAFMGGDSVAGYALSLFNDAEKLVSDVPIVKHAAPIVNIALLGSTAGLIHYQVNKHFGAQLANMYSQVPFVGQYLLQAPSLSNGAAVWIGLKGISMAQSRFLPNTPQLVDEQSADIIGAAAALTGAAIDAVAYFQGGGAVPLLSKLPFIGQYFGDGGQWFLDRNMGAVHMNPGMGAVHMNPGHYGAVHMNPSVFRQGLGTGAAFNGPLVGDKADACHCPRDLAPIELKAAIANRMHSFAQLPKQKVHKTGKASAAAGKLGHRWNWLRKMIGDNNFSKLAKLPPAKRQQVIQLMKEKADPRMAHNKPMGAIGMGAYSAIELGALAQSGVHDTSDISGLVSPLSGAANAASAVGGFGGLLYAGS